MKYWKNTLNWVLTSLVFFALPILLSCYGLGKYWATLENDEIEQEFDLLEQKLLEIRKMDNPRKYFTELLRLIAINSRAEKNHIAKLESELVSLKKTFPGIFRIWVLDKKGELVEKLSFSSSPKKVLQKFRSIYLQKDLSNSSRIQQLEEILVFIRHIFGPEITIGDLESSFDLDLRKSSSQKEKAWFAYYIKSSFSFFVSINSPENWEMLPIKNSARVFNKKNNGKIKISIFQPLVKRNRSDAEMELAIAMFNHDGNPRLNFNGKLFFIMPFSSTAKLCAFKFSENVKAFLEYRFILVVVAILLFSIFAIFSHFIIVKEVKFPINIRNRLSLLFSFASGLPLLVIILSGHDYLFEKEKIKIQEQFAQSEQVLTGFDGRFPEWLAFLTKKLIKLSQSWKTSDFEKNGPQLDNRIPQKFDSDVIFFEKTGRSKVFKINQKKDETSASFIKALGSLARCLIATLNNEEPTKGINSIDILTDLVGKHALDNLLHSLSKIIPHSLGLDSGWIFLYPMMDVQGKARNLACFSWKERHLEHLFLKANLLSTQRHLFLTKLYGVLPDRNEKLDDKPVPENFSDKKFFLNFIRELHLKQTSLHKRMSLRGHEILVSGIKGKELQGAFILAIKSLEPIKSEMKGLRQKLWLFTIACLLLSLFLGTRLSKHFLEPISDITRGVSAVSRKNFDFRLPALGDDEFGKLAFTFNEMMESLSEVELGRMVQESLLPQGDISIGDFRFFGRTRFASRMGGDYFDSKVLSNGCLLIIIGDVSGHGIASAMVMGMAKALLENQLILKEFNPQKILNNLNITLLEAIRKKKMMTCFCGILNPDTGVFSYSNAGHNYPYFFSGEKVPVDLEMPSYPLGCRKKAVFSLENITLSRGDSIMFYSDGLIESQTKKGEVLGFQRVKKEVSHLLSENPEKSVSNIFDWHGELTGNASIQDDITVAILSRNSSLK
ncbi:MAG: SpoIIE family protein phosphatase [Candidatus Riflebacteria bacterium]|nr:SpoIIE family protein phosphatase [Candidatus Riflebacteria bacterium]